MTTTTTAPVPMTRLEAVRAIAAQRTRLDALSREIGAIHAAIPTLPTHERAGREAEMQTLRAQAVAILDGEMQPLQARVAEIDAEELAATHADASRDGYITTALYPKLSSHRTALTHHQNRLRQVIAQRDMSAAAAERQADHLNKLRTLAAELNTLAAEVGGPVGADLSDAVARLQAHEPSLYQALHAQVTRRDTAAAAIAEVEAAIAGEQRTCDDIAAEIIALQSQETA